MTTFPVSQNRCRGCRFPITWTEQRRQYLRMGRCGLTKAEAKQASPRCGKCVTRWLRGRAAPTEHPQGRGGKSLETSDPGEPSPTAARFSAKLSKITQNIES
jgi:hypothetical protein